MPSFSGIAGSMLVDVADTTSIDAEINVDETDIARVRVGAEARVVPAAFPDKTLSGTVDQVAIAPRQQAGQNKSYPVRIRLDEHRGRGLSPGHELPRRGAHGLARRRQGARGARAGAALRGQSGQVVQGGKIGRQRLRLRRRPRHQAHRHHRHRRRQLHRHHVRPEGRRAGRRRPGEDTAVPARRREGEHQRAQRPPRPRRSSRDDRAARHRQDVPDGRLPRSWRWPTSI